MCNGPSSSKIAAVNLRGTRPRKEQRRTIEAIIRRLDTGAKWRSMPAGLGDWHLDPVSLEGSGLMFLRRMRAEQERTPVIAITNDNPVTGYKPLSLGADEPMLILTQREDCSRNCSLAIFMAAWKNGSEIIDTFIYKLRKKLAAADADAPIRNVRGRGYMLRLSAETANTPFTSP